MLLPDGRGVLSWCDDIWFAASSYGFKKLAESQRGSNLVTTDSSELGSFDRHSDPVGDDLSPQAGFGDLR